MTLESAIALAAAAHAGQKDKAGEPYILHPLRVMAHLSDPGARIVAVLHDVLEDTAVTEEILADQGLEPELLEILKLVTHQKGQSYEEYLRTAASHPTAKAVKLADIADNSDPVRLAKLALEVRAYLEKKYLRALEILENPKE